MPTQLIDTIPDDLRLYLFVSARYLQELRIALQRLGITSGYERSGTDGMVMPRLRVDHPALGELGEVVWACTSLTDGQWWFEWFHQHEQSRRPICHARNTHDAARLIAHYLFDEQKWIVKDHSSASG